MSDMVYKVSDPKRGEVVGTGTKADANLDQMIYHYCRANGILETDLVWVPFDWTQKHLSMLPLSDLPRDKNYPADAVQCDECGGHGCEPCEDRGWFPCGHPKGRRCYRDACANPIPPAQVAVYCSDKCAFEDAGPIAGKGYVS